ncbi:PAS and ANTAR domain-containing protein [Mycobacterium mantenii]|uniref:Antitermination regulator n=1 Tax=Mycobacterium mantenii TaxID=560555 RepID=A0A1A2TXC5_MYCNT|nr:PAS and ANTAR domain-containing protein [Mycobacterium mantenii]OBH40368.1 antitermination regulator [Mycobacterium mantenii]OBH51450.1 antitermination regulator [Mycobacterium mantenii]OBH71268.1 antitermination regulator [Mycobacterium mantenii]OBH81011.1 antitermination regulator [Mycobacterium mantenii]
MAWKLDGQAAAIERGLAGATPQCAGWFRFYFEGHRWVWSDQVQRMHGYQPGTVTPTTELVLAHKHPADRPQVTDGINDMIKRRQAFSTRHRIVDTGGMIHHVLVVGDQFCDDDGKVVGTHGFYIEVTPAPTRSREDSISAKVAEIAGRRGVIDRTKGMLMLIYGIDEDAAFNMLKTVSQTRNIKLGLLAQRIAEDFAALGKEVITARSRFDQRLRSVQPRGPDEAEGA